MCWTQKFSFSRDLVILDLKLQLAPLISGDQIIFSWPWTFAIPWLSFRTQFSYRRSIVARVLSRHFNFMTVKEHFRTFYKNYINPWNGHKTKRTLYTKITTFERTGMEIDTEEKNIFTIFKMLCLKVLNSVWILILKRTVILHRRLW